MFLITLTIAGDFDITQAKLGYKIFCEIKRGQDIQNGKKLVALSETKTISRRQLRPFTTINSPSVYQYHPDSYALEV
jgi:zinc protease